MTDFERDVEIKFIGSMIRWFSILLGAILGLSLVVTRHVISSDRKIDTLQTQLTQKR